MSKILSFLSKDNLDRKTWFYVSGLFIFVGIIEIFTGGNTGVVINGIILFLFGFIFTRKKH